MNDCSQSVFERVACSWNSQDMKFNTGLLFVVAVVALAVADEKNITSNGKGRKVRRGDNLIPRVVIELTSNLKDELQLINPGQNAIFSPVSITSVLGMVMLGARGKTYKELSNTLVGHIPGNMEKNVATMHRKLKYLLERLEHHPDSKPGAHVSIANAVFVQKDVEIQDAFSRSIHDIYDSNVLQLDFLRDSEGTKNTINSWVDENTKGCIKELYSSPPDPNTQIVLANAIYFVGEWEYPFDPKDTVMSPFHAVKQDISVPMMTGQGGFYYFFESPELNCSILGMSYKGKHVTMYFVLPNNNLTDFVEEVSLENLMNLKDKAFASEEQVIVSIPKMKLQSTIKLQEPLANLGLKTLFGGGANLRGISNGVFVNDAVHKVNIEITETGTIAAAVTAFGMTRMSHPLFILDRPFLFFIYHEKAKVPLFWGTIWDPSG